MLMLVEGKVLNIIMDVIQDFLRVYCVLDSTVFELLNWIYDIILIYYLKMQYPT